jgi:pSer/pThr/pTyr-binding forkhead associated (FHA) protein
MFAGSAVGQTLVLPAWSWGIPRGCGKKGGGSHVGQGRALRQARGRIGEQFVFKDHTVFLVGRGSDCALQLGSRDISRRHCLLDVDPPMVRIRDLGSRNGTFVNGEIIGGRVREEQPGDSSPADTREFDLFPGDEIRLGSAVLEVEIHETDDRRPVGAVEGAIFV